METPRGLSAEQFEAVNKQLKASSELNDFIRNLFRKADPDILQELNIETLADIVSHSHKAFEQFIKGDSISNVSGFELGDVQSIVVVLLDQPFIVSSIAECFRIRKIDTELFVHPIFKTARGKVSLSYIRLKNCTSEIRTELEREINNVLLSLNTISKDFLSMHKHASEIKVTDPEVKAFLDWLCDDSFVFLGVSKRDLKKLDIKEAFGIFNVKELQTPLLEETLQDANTLKKGKLEFLATKLSLVSPVQRRLHASHFCIIDGEKAEAVSIVGLLTSKAVAQESASVPLIRVKVKELIESEQVEEDSYDYDHIIDTINRMPKDEALVLETKALQTIVSTALGAESLNDTRVAIVSDKAERGSTIVVFVPRSRFTNDVRRRIQRYIEEKFGEKIGIREFSLDFTVKPQVKLYFYVAHNSSNSAIIDTEQLEEDLDKLSQGWEEQLRKNLGSSFSFPAEYQATHSVEQAEKDILKLKTLSDTSPLVVTISDIGPQRDSFVFNIYSTTPLTLTKILPVLEQAGLTAISSNIFSLPKAVIHKFHVTSRMALNADHIGSFEAGIAAVLRDEAEADPLNCLLVYGMSLFSVNVLRSYTMLLWQVRKFAARRTIVDALSSNIDCALLLSKLFTVKFDPKLKLSIEERKNSIQELLTELREALRLVTDPNRDRIIRSIALLMEHTVRTNAYTESGTFAYKLHSEKIDILPMPRPLYEIYVYSPLVEGIHLRSGKIARGGLRWSDRHDDFRSEVLGLVKTQRVKNVVIVPTGAKGGFIVKNPSILPVEKCYEKFIDACLSLADNYKDDKVVQPKNLIIYDDPDPYFVVAADKGTATFSDIANGIAIEKYNFWLGDAFASGGSVGYDHKKYGITAKGTWECVKRHFADMGLDYEKTPFTVVGIGDMSGDVFGNGLLLSNKIKLVAAFNHKHIFLDPDPNPDSSFVERERLFKLPRSQWSDYNQALISKGGGVISRLEKEIAITPEVRKALSLPSTTPKSVSGEELVTLILKAHVDLLWNGGIGTYVKSSSESHSDVNDGSNDAVRINANQVRARVIGEGGNLGFTQNARIEYSTLGGRINTDAIDNSGGVDLSDHEVNIKILLQAPMLRGELTIAERNKLLEKIAPEVVDAVLRNNKSQALTLSASATRSSRRIPFIQSLLRLLSKLGYVNRALDNLPDDDQLQERASKQLGLTRPESAVCIALVKMWIKEALTSSELIKDSSLTPYLISYFPTDLQKKYKDDILRHPLASSIIATQITNAMVDAVGITFIHRMCLAHTVNVPTVMKCLLAAEMMLGLSELREELDRLDNVSSYALFFGARQDLARSLRSACTWFLTTHAHTHSLAEMVETYGKHYQDFEHSAEKIVRGAMLEEYKTRLNKANEYSFPDKLAHRVALLPMINTTLEAMWAAEKAKCAVRQSADIYQSITDLLAIEHLINPKAYLTPQNKWEHQILSYCLDDVRRCISETTVFFITSDSKISLDERLKKNPCYEQLAQTVEELKAGRQRVEALAVLARQMRLFVEYLA